jgi:hypothetical protein
MDATKTHSRTAGFLYLLVVVMAPIRMVYVPSVLFVPGNATAPAANITAHQALFRFGIVTELFAATILVFLTLALYRLLSGVDRRLAVMMVILGSLMVTPITFVNAINDLAALVVSGGGDILSAFEKHQRDGLAMLFLRLKHQVVIVNQIFWGLWLVAYVVVSVTGLALPQYEDTIGSLIFPALAGEPVFMLWLLIKGAPNPS